MGNTYPNHKGNYYNRNHTLYHLSTLDPLGRALGVEVSFGFCSRSRWVSGGTPYKPFFFHGNGLGFRVQGEGYLGFRVFGFEVFRVSGYLV